MTPDGYFRYYTAADFGRKLQFAATTAKEILIETLVEFSERAKAGKR